MADMLVHEKAYRGEALMRKMTVLKIAVCGAGAVGSNLVDNLSRQGYGSFTVIDFDRVEKHNIPTQVWNSRECGMYKAAVLKNRVYLSSGGVVTEVLHRLDDKNVKKYLGDAGLVVDGFDNSASRKVVADFCHAAGKDCLHVGLAKDYAEVVWNERYRVPRDVVAQDVCEYPMARNTILLAVAVASEVITRYVATGDKRDYAITLGDFKVETI